MTDTIFADVSYFQAPVDNSYPYEVLSIRSNDGTFRDPNFHRNYQWCVNACDSGRLTFFIVYFYWRSGPGDVNTHMAMVNNEGGPHPRMVTMIDLESGGNPVGDWSGELNNEYANLSIWLGSQKRVIAYANHSDYYTMWRNKPFALRWIGAGYPTDPHLPNQIAHQYTNGEVWAGGLPLGASPFGNCDMNSANGLDPQKFAAACGIGIGDDMANVPQDQWDLVYLELTKKFSSRSKYRVNDGMVDTMAGMLLNVDAMTHEALIERNALLGNADAITRVKREADKGDMWAQLVYDKCPK